MSKALSKLLFWETPYSESSILSGATMLPSSSPVKDARLSRSLRGENRGHIRGAGLAQIIKDRETKAKIAKQCSFFSEYYGSSEDPNYTLIQLQLTEIEYLRPQRPHPTAEKITL